MNSCLKLVLLVSVGSGIMGCARAETPFQASPTQGTLPSSTAEPTPRRSTIATATVTQALELRPTPFPTSLSQLPADVPVISTANASGLQPLWSRSWEDGIWRLGWSEDERFLGIGGVPGIAILGLPGMREYRLIRDGLFDFAFTRVFDWDILLVASSGNVKMWDLELLKPIEGYGDPEDAPYLGRLALSADGQRLASGAIQEKDGDLQGVIHVWEVESGMKVFTINLGICCPDGDLAFRPDGAELASTDPLERTVTFWDAASGDRLGSIKGANVRYSPDGDFIATSAVDSVWIWLSEGRRLIRELEVKGEELDVPLAFSPDGALFAAGFDRITIWKTENWTEVANLPVTGGTLRFLQFSPSGRYMASLTRQRTFESQDVIEEYTVTLWAAEN